MPALQPQAAPDKAMTLDLAAVQSANAPPATAASAPAPANTEFSGPQNPWMQPEPASTPAPAPAPPPSPSSALSQQRQNPWAAVQSQKAAKASVAAAAPIRPAVAPAMPPVNSQPAPPPAAGPPSAVAPAAPAETDFSEPSSTSAQPAPSRTAVYPPVPSELSQYIPSKPAASSVVAAPPVGSGPPAQRQCFTNAEGVKICYMYDQRDHNTTDVHKEGGVNDYHNQAGALEKQGIQGHIPGNNITNTLNNLGQNAPPNEYKEGNTVFQGKADTEVNHQQDIHKDNSTFTDHETNSGDGDFDWKSAYKGPDGSKEMAEINKDGQYKDEEDTRVDANGKNKVDNEEFKGSDDHRFMSDKPGTKDDSSLIWDEDWQQKKQKEEFQGKGVYDLHEESSSEHKVQAKVDGDQGWQEFEQDMNDFDNTFFDEDADWRKKMQDPRYQATATTPAGLAIAGLSSTAAVAGVAKRNEIADLRPQEDRPWSMDGLASDGCALGEDELVCLCRHGLESISCAILMEERAIEGGEDQKETSMLADAEGEKFAIQKRQQPEVEGLAPRGEASNPYKEAWEYFKDTHEAYEYDKTHKPAEPFIVDIPGSGPHRRDEGAIEARDLMSAAMAPDSGASDFNKSQMDRLGIAIAILLGIFVALMFGCFIGTRVRRGWQVTRERQERRRYMRELEGYHTLDARSREESQV